MKKLSVAARQLALDNLNTLMILFFQILSPFSNSSTFKNFVSNLHIPLKNFLILAFFTF